MPFLMENSNKMPPHTDGSHPLCIFCTGKMKSDVKKCCYLQYIFMGNLENV